MKVYNYGAPIINTSINYNSIKAKEMIDNGDSILLPYENREFLVAIKELIDDVFIMTCPIWKEPDYENSKCYFYIDGNEINLVVEALPRRYSSQEKEQLLREASQSIRQDGYSDYCEMLDRFDAIDNILNSTDPMGEMYTYCLEMSAAERSALFTFFE